MSQDDQQLTFTHLTPLRNIDNGNGARLFNERQPYPIMDKYERGSYTIDGEHFHFGQTTFVLVNETGEKTYVPFTSGNFSKVRSAVRVGEASAV